MATKEKYIEGIGRRKTSTARVRITPSKKDEFVVNDKSIIDYFGMETIADTAREALKDVAGHFAVSVHVMGGGIKGQAVAVRHGLSRALIKHDIELRGDLKAKGFLKRDPRMVERKKFGLRKARRAPQWSKR